MSTMAALPSTLRTKLDSVARRLRWLRLVKGTSVLTIVLLVSAGAALAADQWLLLSPQLRIGILAAWALLGVLTAWFYLVRPLSRRLDLAVLAAAVEEQYPDLAERLTSVVEVAGETQPCHGSPGLIALLLEETAEQTRPLDFDRAVSADRAAQAGVTAGIILLFALILILAAPARLAEMGQRFLSPWPDAGDPQAAPELVTTPVPNDPPLTAQVSLTVTPPGYARAQQTQTIPGLADLTALQFSRIAFDVHLSGIARSVVVEWSPPPPAGAGETRATWQEALALDADRRVATGELPLPTAGAYRYRLILESEHGTRTELDPHSLAVQLDAPPRIAALSGEETLPAVLPYQPLPLELALEDDLGVGGAELQVQVNQGAVSRTPIALNGLDTPHASARFTLKLADLRREDGQLLRSGDEVRYRVRAVDNRRMPFLGPQDVLYPADHWRALRIARVANGLDQEKIAQEHSDLRERLEAARREFQREQRVLYRLRTESRRLPALNPNQTRDLEVLRKDHQDNKDKLSEAARRAGEEPALRDLAERVQELTSEEVSRAGLALGRVPREETAEARDDQWQSADRELTAAIRKIDSLLRENTELAKERAEFSKLELAAEHERQLADRAADLAMRDPVKDPTLQREKEEIQREQHDLSNELEHLMREDARLRESLDALRAEQAQELAERAQELARLDRELDKARQETEQQRRVQQFSELARKQQALAERVAKLSEQTRESSRAAGTQPLKPKDAEQAAESLKHGEANEALRQQDQAGNDLDRTARDLQHGAELARDPKEAARQLARLEQDLRQRMQEGLNQGTRLESEKMQALRREQAALEESMKDLSIPPQNQEALKEKKEASSRAAQTENALAARDPRQAFQQMEQAQHALERLADRLPPLQQRQNEARQELARLRARQEEVFRQVEQAAYPHLNDDRKDPKKHQQLLRDLKDASTKQADVADRLARLDAPNQEAHRARAQEAVNQALQTVLDGKPQDMLASQQDARRQLERLEQALQGGKPVDDSARELARRQQQLAEESARLAADPKAPANKQEELRQKQRQLTLEANNLYAPEAPQRREEAAEATRQAEQATNADPTAAATREKMQQAAEALDRLAKQVTGRETETDRAARLARRQSEEAADTERQAKANPDQPPSPEAQKRQQQITEEAHQLHSGDEGQKQKVKANQALERVQHATRADDRARAQREAAQALQDLAQQIARQEAQANEQTTTAPRQAAQDLARRQDELARQTQKARDEAAKRPGEPGKQELRQAMDRIAQEQRRLNDKAARLPAPLAPRPTEEARSAMARADSALDQPDAAQAQQRQQEAAQKLNELARALPEKPPAASPAREPRDAVAALPRPEQAEQARELAKEQRELREAVQRALNQPNNLTPNENPITDLAKQQQEIAHQAGELAKEISDKQGNDTPPTRSSRQAASSARKASEQAQVGAMQRAAQSGEQAAREMSQLADQLSKPEAGEKDPQSAQRGEQARQLAGRQADLNRKLAQQAGNADAARNQQLARQEELQKQIANLAEDIRRLAPRLQQSTPQAAHRMWQAGDSAQQAHNLTQQAQNYDQQNNQQNQAHQTREQAAGALDRTAQQMQQAQAMVPRQASPSAETRRAAQAINQAQGQMQQAQNQLQQGQPGQAQGSMQQAADSLQQASQQMAGQRPNSSTKSNRATASSGVPGTAGPRPADVDPSSVSPDLKKYAGKRWGQLPGEVQTRIVQELTTQYGPDYAEIIKGYYERLAEGKK